jgi:hypothetical protein
MMLKRPTDQMHQRSDGKEYASPQKTNEFPRKVFENFFELNFADHPQELQIEQLDRIQKFLINSHYEGNRSTGNPWDDIGAAH